MVVITLAGICSLGFVLLFSAQSCPSRTQIGLHLAAGCAGTPDFSIRPTRSAVTQSTYHKAGTRVAVLTGEVVRFVAGMLAPQTEPEWMARAISDHARDHPLERSLAPTR